MKTPLRMLGILVSDIHTPSSLKDSRFLRQLCKAGIFVQLQVIVFSYTQINWTNNTVIGFVLDSENRWKVRTMPLPTLLYNRCFIHRVGEYAVYKRTLQKLKRHGCTFIGEALAGKWQVYLALKNVPQLKKHLPRTRPYTGSRMLKQWFQHNDAAFLKPVNGSHGKSTLSICKKEDHTFLVKGRTSRNREVEAIFHHMNPLVTWVQQWVGRRPFLVQEHLNLHMVSGNVYDLRVLVQKNGRGQWQTTGMAIRKGTAGSHTSNLNGGGTAQPVEPLLVQQFGNTVSSCILLQVYELSKLIPKHIEVAFGLFCELGLDFGIDHIGHVWLLEVNSKPGRSIFRKLGLKRERIMSVLNPLRYASYLLTEKETLWEGNQ